MIFWASIYILPTKRNIPLQESVVKWPHLQQFFLPKIDAEVSVLIGTNAPMAFEPWKVIASVEDGPYAVDTMLGRTMNRLLRKAIVHSTASGSIQVSANRIAVTRLDELWSQQLKCDFPEYEQDDLTWPHCQLELKNDITVLPCH